MSNAAKVTALLEQITGTDEVQRDPDLDLTDLGLLDSLGMVELMVGLSEQFGIEISPAEVAREEWSTPRKIIAYIDQRIAR